MSPKVKDLNDILPPEYLPQKTQSFEEYLGMPLVIHACQDVSGNNGVYKRITVSLPDSEDLFVIATGASQPKQVLDWVEKNNAFPFTGKFVKAGRAYLLTGV